MNEFDDVESPQRNFWQKMTLKEKLLIIIGILYVVSPVDFIPEAVLGPLGLLDDGGAVVALLTTANSISRR